jgi:signal transduction histidine kinase
VNLARSAYGGTFRLSVIFSAACVLSGLLLFVGICCQTRDFETRRICTFVATEAQVVSQASIPEIIWTVRSRLSNEYHDVTFAALFGPDGVRIAGNLAREPVSLPVDGRVHHVDIAELDVNRRHRMVIGVATRLANGDVLVLGRGVGVVDALERIVAGALLLGLVPAVGPALLVGLWLSRRAGRQVQVINQSIERFMHGNVHERLPEQGVGGDVGHLTRRVNCMLAQIERLLEEVQGVSDNIAHDLRTPLARVRTLLERGRDKARTREELALVADRAIAGLDQAHTIITALLRIGEIEGGQRRAGFAEVDLGEIVREAGDLYAPIAEAKLIGFELSAGETPMIWGDRDLLMEAIANLLDNAIKFTAPGGKVRIGVQAATGGPIVRVADSGPGIPPEEREAIMKRFYRVDKSRHINGSGLGLSIVLAIVRLHDFDVVVGDGQPGCWFELRCHKGASDTGPARLCLAGQ